MRRSSISHQFVDFIPSPLDDGVLYISIPYATVVHRCACGCGNKVVTPLSPAEWALTYDGDTVSLHPSIGNWQFPCRSHYWVRHGRIEWARAWTDEEIARGRHRDANDLEKYFAGKSKRPQEPAASTPGRESVFGWLRRFLTLRWIRSRSRDRLTRRQSL